MVTEEVLLKVKFVSKRIDLKSFDIEIPILCEVEAKKVTRNRKVKL